MLDSLTNLLGPTGRKALYAIVGTLATAAVVLGFAPDAAVENWVEVVVQVLGIVGLILASIKAKRVDYTAFYAAGAGLVAVLTTLGVFKDGTSSQMYDLLAQVAAAVPLLIATMRTNTTVPTGQPKEEYLADSTYVPEHGGGIADEQRNELGAFDTGPLFIVAAVLVIIVCVVWLVQAL